MYMTIHGCMWPYIHITAGYLYMYMYMYQTSVRSIRSK